MDYLALDIGGANIKLADGRGKIARSIPFALWKTPELLIEKLRSLLSGFPESLPTAVTMTGELVDCFVTKQEGVEFILSAVAQAADKREILVYLCDGSFTSVEKARSQPLLTAASNWHALASYAGRYASRGSAILVDIGSTTCDVIPLFDGKVVSRGKTDTERLLYQELVYTGVVRSPMCAVVDVVPYRGQNYPVAQEFFATTRDVYLTLKIFPEDPHDIQTANQKPATIDAAADRLARMICTDRTLFSKQDAIEMARFVAKKQAEKITNAVKQVHAHLPSSLKTVIVSGQGEFLARQALDTLSLSVAVVSLTKQLGTDISQCAPAYGLAVLAGEMNDQRKT